MSLGLFGAACVMGIAAMTIGYPATETEPAKPRKEGYFRIIK